VARQTSNEANKLNQTGDSPSSIKSEVELTVRFLEQVN